MDIMKKSLHLNYVEPKDGKDLHKSFAFNINVACENDAAKEVAIELAKLFDKDINDYSLNTKVTL